MSREIKFEFIWKKDSTIVKQLLTLDEIIGTVAHPRRHGKNMPLIAKRQFTGLKDKNGVEIYEGGILRGKSKVFGDITGTVDISKYQDNEEHEHKTHFGWNIDGIPLVDLVNDGLEVIGNIHQNSELLNHE